MHRCWPIILVLAACGQPLELPEQAPLADAGNDQIRKLLPRGTTIGLDGSASCDPDGRMISTFEWTLASKPSGSSATLSRDSGLHVTFVADIEGRYLAELVVTADGIESTADEVVIELRTDLVTDIPPVTPSSNRCGDSL